MSLRALADRRPVSAAAVALVGGIAALVVSVPSITLAATEPAYDGGDRDDRTHGASARG